MAEQQQQQQTFQLIDDENLVKIGLFSLKMCAFVASN